MNNILHCKANWIGHILRTSCLLHDAFDGQIMEMKEVGERRTQFFDDSSNRKNWKLKKGAEKKKWRRQFIA